MKHFPATAAIAGALLLAAQAAGAQTSTTAPGGMRTASEPMTNKAAHPPGSTASGVAEKKPAKPGAQSGAMASGPAK